MIGWDDVAAIALALPGAEADTSYGQPAIKVAANGRTFLCRGRTEGSFVLHLDRDTKAMLIATDRAPIGRRRITRAGRRCWYDMPPTIPSVSPR